MSEVHSIESDPERRQREQALKKLREAIRERRIALNYCNTLRMARLPWSPPVGGQPWCRPLPPPLK